MPGYVPRGVVFGSWIDSVLLLTIEDEKEQDGGEVKFVHLLATVYGIAALTWVLAAREKTTDVPGEFVSEMIGDRQAAKRKEKICGISYDDNDDVYSGILTVVECHIERSWICKFLIGQAKKSSSE